jgi:hypothetical protein
MGLPMAWLPHFLNPWTALAAGTVAAAILVGLYFLKLRRSEAPVSSTLLWKKAIQDLQVNAPFQKLRNNLLLILQLLMLLFLAAALARPVVNFTPGAGAINVILIDRSGSMNATDGGDGRTRLEEAKRRARALVGTMDRNAQTMVIAFADSAEVVQPFTGDHAALTRAIDSIAPTDRPTRLKLAYQLADAQGGTFARNASNSPLPQVWLYSDGRAMDRDDVHLRAHVSFDSIGSAETGNIAIVALDARRNYKEPQEVEVFARLANFGPKPVKADVELRIDGQIAAVKSVSLAPHRWEDPQWNAAHAGQRDPNFAATDSLDFTLNLAGAAVLTIEQMNKQSDALAADDSASLIVPPPKPLRVLLVTPGNFFLERVLHSLQLKNFKILSPKDYVKEHPTDFDVYVFDRFAPDAKVLPPAGRFIDIDAIPPGMTLKPVTAKGTPVLLHDVKVLDWKRDHPVLRQLMLSRLFVADVLKLDIPAGDQILIDGTAAPLLLLHRQGERVHLVIPFDLLRSNWPMQLSFPIFMHNALRYMALGSSMDVRQSYHPGDAPDIPRADVLDADPGLKPIALSGPGGTQSVAAPKEGDVVLPALNRVGVYTLKPAIPGHEKLAVNMLSADESNMIPAPAPAGGEALQASGALRGRLDLWWWIIACLFLPMLLIEWYVYTRRAHLG